MRRIRSFCIFATGLVVSIGILTSAHSETDETRFSELKALYARPASIPFPANAPYSPQIATLGKMLFFDPRLSSAGNMSCSSCHQPSFGWETASEVAIGSRGIPLQRAAPPTMNLAWASELFWDGRSASLEHQAALPITDEAEMNSTLELVVLRLNSIDYYRTWFRELFPDGTTADNVLKAIAMYERSIVSSLSNFDLWVRGDETAIDVSAKRGFLLFNDKMGCAVCHSGWNFTDNLYHDIGVITDDIGRFAIDPSSSANRFAFKTPTLRDINVRAPYMHNGSIASLKSVLLFYQSGGVERPSNSTERIAMSRTERDDLIAFLRSLTSNELRVEVPLLPN